MAKKPAHKKNRKSGQSSVEYILVIAAVVGVIFVFGKQFKERIAGVTGTMFGQVDSGIKGLSNDH